VGFSSVGCFLCRNALLVAKRRSSFTGVSASLARAWAASVPVENRSAERGSCYQTTSDGVGAGRLRLPRNFENFRFDGMGLHSLVEARGASFPYALDCVWSLLKEPEAMMKEGPGALEALDHSAECYKWCLEIARPRRI